MSSAPAIAVAEEPRFRVNARNIYLTYPRCNLSKEELLLELGKIKTFVNYCICQETHQDGSFHLHAILKYSKPVNCTSNRFFDIKGFHPNIQSARKVEDVLKYIRKDGNVIENWPNKRSFSEILDEAETCSQFLDLVRDNQTEKYILHLEKIEYAAQRLFARPPSPYKVDNECPWILSDEINNWLSIEFTKKDRPKSLWLCGPSRTGKTQWARSLGTHNYWNGMSCLDTFSESATYLVIDDIDWQYVTSKKQLFGAQKEFVATDKYRKKRTIKWGKPTIYCFNPDQDPWPNLSVSEKEWYKLNVTQVYIYNKLY